MTKPKTPTSDPLVVSPREAGVLLALGQTRIYELIDTHELESFRHGGARRITTQSIQNYIERQLAADARNRHEGSP